MSDNSGKSPPGVKEVVAMLIGLEATDGRKLFANVVDLDPAPVSTGGHTPAPVSAALDLNKVIVRISGESSAVRINCFPADGVKVLDAWKQVTAMIAERYPDSRRHTRPAA